jgi:hypothetical protein
MSAADNPRDTPAADTPEDSAAEPQGGAPSSINPLMKKKKAELIEELETLRATHKDLCNQVADLRAIVAALQDRVADRARAAELVPTTEPQEEGDDFHDAPEPGADDQLAREAGDDADRMRREVTAEFARARNDAPAPADRDADIRRRAREATVDTLGTTRSAAGGKRTAKIPDPPIFYNEEERDAQGFEQWFRDIENKLSCNYDHFLTDRARQAYIESRIGGKAKNELSPYLEPTYPEPVDTAAKLLVHL